MGNAQVIDSLAPSTEPTNSPTVEPTEADTSTTTTTTTTTESPTTTTTPAPTEEQSTTTTPLGPDGDTTAAPTTTTCPNLEQVERADYPCECYTVIDDCDDAFCVVDGDSCTPITAEFVAVAEEQVDVNAAQAIVAEAPATSETNSGMLMTALVIAVAVTVIALAAVWYLVRKRQQAKWHRMTFGNKDSISAVSAQSDESSMMTGSSGDMVWETNVMAHDEERMIE